jgi:glycosyltransferase involved in cell wall biosynthesis
MAGTLQIGAKVASDGRRPDILFVITDLQVGGSERQLMLLASALAKDGLAISVYSFIGGSVRAELERAGVEVIVASAARAMRVPRGAFGLFRFMTTRRPHLVHFYLPEAYLVGAPLALLARVPLRVMSRRSLNAYQHNGFVRMFERVCHRAMNAVVGNSLPVIAQLRAEGVRADRLRLIYNGIDADVFRPGPRSECRMRIGLSSEGLVMAMVANLILYKGHSDLFNALSLAAPRLPGSWRLLIVGRDDGIGKLLRAQVHKLGLEDNIVFLGSRDDVAVINGASDIGFLCSHEEGFSNAILEGMAAGLPMVVTDVGGNAEAVLDGETGMVVPPRDPEKLADAIVRLARDPALRERMGKAGHDRVRKYFTLQDLIANHRQMYDALRVGRGPADLGRN